VVFWSFIGLYTGFAYFQVTNDDDTFAGVQNRVGLLASIPIDRTLLGGAALGLSLKYQTGKERFSSMYRASSAYIAAILSALPVNCGTVLLVITLPYYIGGLKYSPFTAYLIYIGLNELYLVVGIVLGILIGTVITDFVGALAVATLAVIMIKLFNSVVVNLQNMTWILRWISYISGSFYTIQGLMQNEFDGEFINGQTGEYWLELFALDLVSVMWCAGALIIMVAVFGGMAYVSFRQSTNPRFNLTTVPHSR
jgi:ABC-type multidrug transport system permease subunit